MAQHRPHIGGADGTGGQGVVHFPDGNGRGADNPHAAGQDGGGDGQNHIGQGVAENGDDKEGEDQVGEGHPHIHAALHYGVDLAHHKAGGQADDGSDAGADDNRQEADQHGDAGAVDDAGKDVAAEVVGAKEKLEAGGDQDVLVVLLLVGVGGDEVGKDCQQDHHRDDGQPYGAEELVPEVIEGVPEKPRPPPRRLGGQQAVAEGIRAGGFVGRNH